MQPASHDNIRRWVQNAKRRDSTNLTVVNTLLHLFWSKLLLNGALVTSQSRELQTNPRGNDTFPRTRTVRDVIYCASQDNLRKLVCERMLNKNPLHGRARLMTPYATVMSLAAPCLPMFGCQLASRAGWQTRTTRVAIGFRFSRTNFAVRKV